MEHQGYLRGGPTQGTLQSMSRDYTQTTRLSGQPVHSKRESEFSSLSAVLQREMWATCPNWSGVNMDSSRARCRIAALLVIAVLFIGPSLFAQVKVKTPGTQFSVVTGKATVDNVADGRRFRGEGREVLKIRGTLPTPSSGAVSQLHKLQRLAIHFHGRPQGPTIISVQLCNGANCWPKFVTNLKGDYTTRETIYTKGLQYANVWVYNPPEMVGSQSTVVLEIRFPGGIDSPIEHEDLESILTVV